jgi:hypothetical protein
MDDLDGTCDICLEPSKVVAAFYADDESGSTARCRLELCPPCLLDQWHEYREGYISGFSYHRVDND